MAADAWGVDDGYWDVSGTWHGVADEVADELRASMGALDHPHGPPAGPPLWFVAAGDTPSLHSSARITLEDGGEVLADRHLPPDLPIGHHDLHPDDGGPSTRLVVSPVRCHLPDDLRGWGWAVQLYAIRSRHSWGIGDLADVADLGRWATASGATAAVLSPLHAPRPTWPQQPSPYYPSSRLWRNPVHLSIEQVPGFSEAPPDLALALHGLAAAGRALDGDRVIDRDRVWALKRAALEWLWEAGLGRAPDPAFVRWRKEQGRSLERYAVHAALCDHHQLPWREWPAEHRHPDASGVERFAAQQAGAVSFHAWLQWLVDAQLAEAGGTIPLVADLAIGVDPDGADAWRWQDLYAPGVRVGAPPDEFNAAGQDWGLPPFIPWALRAAHYEPFIEAVRATLRHAGGIRVDHVMGLFRLYWIAAGSGPDAGGYVRYRADELLHLIAIESVRAGAVVAGEDLGTVEEGVREELARRGLLSTRLVWFEEAPPRHVAQQALAAVTTHDLPTVAGLLTGADAAAREAIGVRVDAAADEEMRGRLVRAAAEGGADDDASPADVTTAVHRALAESPAALVVATLDDALGVEERPNIPGTTVERPNWSLALPLLIEALGEAPGVAATIAVMRTGRAHRPAQ
jgi:4-alpha-glucanotransferase